MKSKVIAQLLGYYWRHDESDRNEFSFGKRGKLGWHQLNGLESVGLLRKLLGQIWDKNGLKKVHFGTPTDWISVGLRKLLGQIWDKNGLKKVHFGSFRLPDHAAAT
jgi:hypothetical protein